MIMESPNMYDAQSHQVGQQQMQAELKKNGQLLGQGNNNNNNNNSNLQVNHNQQTNGVSKVSASKASLHQQYAEHCANSGELTDLNTPEMSLDLQHLIDDSHFNDGLLDMLNAGANGTVKQARLPAAAAANNGYGRAAALAYMPQPVHSAASYHHGSNSCSDSNSSSSESPSIKEEPLDPADYRRHCQQYAPGYAAAAAAAAQGPAGPFANGAPTFTTLTGPGGPVPHPGVHQQQQQQQQGRAGMKPVMAHQQQQQQHPGGQVSQPGQVGSRKQSKCVDKASDEYRRRRERNNIAVRKSREKAKVRSRETEERVKHLVKENEVLRKKIEVLSEELNVLRSLFGSVGVLPDSLQREISRHIDQFQHHVSLPGM